MSGSGKMTFTLAEAAELLSCHRETLRRAIRDGELRAAKLGREFRISRPELEAFWTACGGGDLFAPPAGRTPRRPEDEKQMKSGRKKGGEDPGPRQLSLLEKPDTPPEGEDPP